MKNKILSMLLVSAMAVSMLAGCGNSSTTDDAGSKTETETKTDESDDAGAADETGDTAEGDKNPVTINTVSMFGGTDPNVEVYEGINTKLMEDYPYIEIADNSQTSDEAWKSTVAADFSVGNEPDVLQFFTDANANEVLATDKFVTIEEIRKEYPDYAKDTDESALVLTANPDGVQRAVPTTGFWEGLYCNKDLFDEYGIDLPTDWDSLVKAIEVFKENDIIPIAVSLNHVPHYWIEFCLLYSAGVESYESIPDSVPAEWAKGLDTLKTLRDLGAFPEDTDTVDNDFVGQLFRDKKAAMQLDGSWYAGNITETDNTVVVAFPGVEEQKAEKGAMVAGFSSGFYITKKAWDDPDKRDAAVKFVMAHTSQESLQAYWEATGGIAVPTTSVTPVDGMTPMALSALEYTAASTSSSAATDARLGQQAYGIIIANAVKVSVGQMTGEEALEEALAKYKEMN